MKDAALFLLLGAMAGVNLIAQVGDGMGGTTPTPGSGTQSVQANPRDIGTHSPIYLSGKVVADDGAPLVTQNATIERVCGGISKTVAYTDSKGRFNFQWGDRNMIGHGCFRRRLRAAMPTPGFGVSQSAGGANALAADPFGNR